MENSNLKNFEVVALPGFPIIEIIFKNKLYDLHNACEFSDLRYNINNRLLQLDFIYYENNGLEKQVLRFEATEIDKFQILPRDEEMPFSEDDCLDELTLNEKQITLIFHGGMRTSFNFGEINVLIIN